MNLHVFIKFNLDAYQYLDLNNYSVIFGLNVLVIESL